MKNKRRSKLFLNAFIVAGFHAGACYFSILNLKCGADIGCNLLEFLWGELELGIAEEHVFLTLHGDEVDVSVGHL